MPDLRNKQPVAQRIAGTIAQLSATPMAERRLPVLADRLWGPQTPAIYQLTHLPSGRRYIGRTQNLRKRLQSHRSVNYWGGVFYPPEEVEICILQEWDPCSPPLDCEIKNAEARWIGNVGPEDNVQHNRGRFARRSPESNG